MNGDPRILVIDEKVAGPESPSRLLGGCSYEIETVTTGRAGLDRYRCRPFDVVLTALRLSDMDGFELLGKMLAIDSGAKVIVVTENGSVRLAVDYVKAGAYYFVETPCEPERLRALVDGAIDRRPRIGIVNCVAGIIGTSKPMQDLFAMVEAVARSDANILIVGESGTGKELIANALHAGSRRAGRSFVKINCSALPRDLFENELFGHSRGAFTGATGDKLGLIGVADGGSLLLDEIADMPVESQPKLMRVLQERQFTRLGSSRVVAADFRLIASMNKSPREAIRAGRLREDLYYRIATITIAVPPLRERTEDIDQLAEHMLKRFSAKYAKPIAGFTREAYASMLDYSWPGNIRELENSIERAVLLARGPTIGEELLRHVERRSVPKLPGPARAIADASSSCTVASDDLQRRATSPDRFVDVGLPDDANRRDRQRPTVMKQGRSSPAGTAARTS